MRSLKLGQRVLQSLAWVGCVLFMSGSGNANAQTVSELLEKAIYTEETVGDLDAAIEAYKKVVADSQDSIQAAAQAQYRIGLCYEKQGQSERASEAFDFVVQRYPTATPWVTKAKSHLPDTPELLPVPWQDGDELHFEMKLATGMGVGYQVYRVTKVQKDGRNLWECSGWQTVTINGQSGKSRVLVDGETFAPIESRWRHSMLGEAEANYQKAKVVIKILKRDEPVTLDFDGPVYDNEQAAEMFRRLPLKDGYKAKVEIISPLGAAKVPLELSVSKLETITAPVGTFECYRLELSIGQTFWISNDENRYIVRFQVGGVTANLISIHHPIADESTPVKNVRFTATLPPNWFAYAPSESGNSGSGDQQKSKTTLIDPDAVMDSRIEAGPLGPIKKKHGTPGEWLKSSLGEYKKVLTGFSMGDDGIQEISIGGRDAAIAVFDFQEGDKAMRGQRMTVFGETSAVNVRFTAQANHLGASQSAIESIQSSLHVQ